MKPLVTLEDVRVELGGVRILDGVSAAIPRGQITSLIGVNGSGKTTLLKAILKEVPYRGRVQFHCGHDHSSPLPRAIGYVPQRLSVDSRLPVTVLDILAIALQKRPLFLGVSRSTRSAAERVLSRVFWKPVDVLDRPIEKLSGGELQRVLLALALEPEPELLLLDEPAAGIDFQDQERFYELLAKINAETGVTVVLVSHDLGAVTRHCHYGIRLHQGRVVGCGLARVVVSDELRVGR